MSLIYLNVNILDIDYQVIAQQCNCTSKIAKGLSATLAQKFPNADFYTNRTRPSTPGTVELRYIGRDENNKPRWIAALYAQYRPGKASEGDTREDRLGWFKSCLDKIVDYKNFRNITFPYKIGCGLAGGDWEDYKRILEDFACNFPHIQVYIACMDDKVPELKVENADWNTATLEEYTKNINLEGWKEFLESEIENEVIKDISKKLEAEVAKDSIFPPIDKIYRTFELVKPKEIKVIIIGQDPYHDDNQAMGICFSVPDGQPIPSSLQNIYKEMSNDVGVDGNRRTGNLEEWCKQGVFMINTALTVRAHTPGSHSKWWHEQFTPDLMRYLAKTVPKAVIILWGKHAENFGKYFNDNKRFKKVISVHPSGLSAHKGFFGSKPFSKTNKYLKELELKPIEW